jgi:hypothetical protein
MELQMNIINKIDISVFSLLVLLFIYANARKQTQKTLLQSKLFRAMIITLFVATAAEALSNTLDGLPNSSIIPWSIL